MAFEQERERAASIQQIARPRLQAEVEVSGQLGRGCVAVGHLGRQALLQHFNHPRRAIAGHAF